MTEASLQAQFSAFAIATAADDPRNIFNGTFVPNGQEMRCKEGSFFGTCIHASEGTGVLDPFYLMDLEHNRKFSLGGWKKCSFLACTYDKNADKWKVILQTHTAQETSYVEAPHIKDSICDVISDYDGMKEFGGDEFAQAIQYMREVRALAEQYDPELPSKISQLVDPLDAELYTDLNEVARRYCVPSGEGITIMPRLGQTKFGDVEVIVL